MRRGSFKGAYIYLLAVAAFLQLAAIVSDQFVLQLDAITKKNETQLVLAEMQSENTLNINLSKKFGWFPKTEDLFGRLYLQGNVFLLTVNLIIKILPLGQLTRLL